MDGIHWWSENWFNLLNAIGVVGGLCFTGYSLHSETKTRKVANLLTLTQSHRDIWTEILREPRLTRILSTDVDLSSEPITQEEEILVTLVVQHLGMVFQAMHDDLTVSPEGLRLDVAQFFRLPIPESIWTRIKDLQNNLFVRFVEGCRATEATGLDSWH